jgi:acyl dehydratase
VSVIAVRSARPITEADIFAFCGIAGDFNPIHRR